MLEVEIVQIHRYQCQLINQLLLQLLHILTQILFDCHIAHDRCNTLFHSCQLIACRKCSVFGQGYRIYLNAIGFLPVSKGWRHGNKADVHLTVRDSLKVCLQPGQIQFRAS